MKNQRFKNFIEKGPKSVKTSFEKLNYGELLTMDILTMASLTMQSSYYRKYQL